MKNKLLIWIFLIATILLCYKAYVFLAGLGYKIGGHRGHTTSITESKKRNVFIKELNYTFIPEQLRIQDFTAYIEKGFRYGKNNMNVTDSLGKDEHPFQLIINYKKDNNLNDTIVSFSNEIYSLQKYMPLKKAILTDTITLNVLLNKSMYEIDTLGVVKVWEVY